MDNNKLINKQKYSTVAKCYPCLLKLVQYLRKYQTKYYNVSFIIMNTKIFLK